MAHLWLLEARSEAWKWKNHDPGAVVFEQMENKPPIHEFALPDHREVTVSKTKSAPNDACAKAEARCRWMLKIDRLASRRA